jgi:4'-phosphopantetheinyl transferase
MIYLNDHIEELEMEEALRAVSPQRRQLALRFRHERDQRLSVAAYLLLMQALKAEYGIDSPQEFLFSPHGKPTLKDYPDIHFNLSHCPRAALCVVSDSPVGCDVEAIPERLDTDLCRYCCSDAEYDAILRAERPTAAFTALWTRKEAFLKLTGQGLTKELPTLFSTRGNALRNTVKFQTFTAADGTYIYSTATFASRLPSS